MNFFKKLILWAMVVWLCRADSRPSVDTKLGLIRGLSIKAQFKGKEFNVSRYAGLRYAKPPMGELRFQMPVPYGSYESPFDAVDFTSACPQNDILKLGTNSVNEDCLSLAVYVPTSDSDSPSGYAIMIFIHGGAFVVGGANVYPAEVLSAVGNVIVVVINYRLGILGFANTGDGQIIGNLGLWDQRLAFQWVQDNIASFGGDSSRVTIFGESVGAISVTLHAMYPQNKGLFQNVIAESGSPTDAPIVKENLESLKNVAENLGCRTDTTAAVVDCLKHVETQKLMKANFLGFGKYPFWPTIDGVILKRQPFDMYNEARHKTIKEIDFLRSINLINGVTNAEGAMWLSFLGDVNLETLVVSQADMKRTHIPNSVTTYANPTNRPVPAAVVSVVSAEYTDYSDLTNARKMYVKMMGDLVFSVGCQELSYVHSNSSTSKTWAYMFEGQVERHVIPVPAWVEGANHVDELPAVFGYGFSELGVADFKAFPTSTWELDMSERIMKYWSNFAKYNDPNGKAMADGVKWPQHDIQFSRYIKFNKEDTISKHRLAREVNFWREVIPLVWNSVERRSHMDHSSISFGMSESCSADEGCS